MIKRFCVFSYKEYYPSGGWHDFEASFDSLEEAQACKVDGQYKQIVDLLAPLGQNLREMRFTPK